MNLDLFDYMLDPPHRSCDCKCNMNPTSRFESFFGVSASIVSLNVYLLYASAGVMVAGGMKHQDDATA